MNINDWFIVPHDAYLDLDPMIVETVYPYLPSGFLIPGFLKRVVEGPLNNECWSRK